MNCRSGIPSLLMMAMLMTPVALAQDVDAELAARVAAIRYRPLAVLARIQGHVHLEVSDGSVHVVAADHKLLIEAAEETWRALDLARSKGSATIHFAIVGDAEWATQTKTVPRHPAALRALLRGLGFTGQRAISESVCEKTVPPPNHIAIDGDHVELWIFATPRCANAYVTTVAKR